MVNAGRFEIYSLNQIAVFCNNDLNYLLSLCSKYLPFTFTHTRGSIGHTW